MPLHFGENSEKVDRLQHALIELGYALTRYGADRWLGRETMGAIGRLFAAHGRPFNETSTTVSDDDLAFVYDLQHSMPRNGSAVFPPGTFFDVRAQAGNQHDYGERPWSKVTGICLHHTACILGENPQRWATVGAHLGVSRGGRVFMIHDFNRLIVHGNGWNTETVGIEMDGMYAGIEGDLRTFWKPPGHPELKPQSPTPDLVEATKTAIRWIGSVVEAHGGKLKLLVAHRQASENRQSDPGSALWHAIAIPLHDEMHLTDGGIGFKIGTGYPIPESWDPRCKGIYY